ncbi:MAG: tetratricopeptide repeat protein [Thermodesulfobacteriota bacterium]|nr:tetratricopeptide repeat protein [Thermodesulfobacteriota bacterium]
MSLINQMLKDIEARRQQDGGAPAQPASVMPCHPPQRQLLPWSLILLSVIFVVGLVAGGWWWQSQQQSQRHPVAQQRALVSAPLPPLVAPVSMPPASAIVQKVVETIPDMEPAPAPVLAPVSAPESTPEQDNTVAAAKPQMASSALHDQEIIGKEKTTTSPVATTKAKQAAVVVKTPTLPVTPQMRARKLRDQAQRLVARRRYGAGAILFDQALQIDGGSPTLWRQLAVIYLRAQQHDKALQVADKGCQLYKNDPSLRVIQARLLVELGYNDQALTALQSITLPPVQTSSDYYALLATLQQQHGDLVAAEHNYALLTTAFPQRGDWWFGRAICADHLGQYQQARRYFKQALGLAQLKPALKQYALQQLTRLNG